MLVHSIYAQPVIYMHGKESAEYLGNDINDTITTGIEVVKYDPIVDRLPIDLTQTQSIDLQYKIGQLKDIHQIRRVAGGCIEIDYPVEDVSQFDELRLIESQFAACNAVDLDNQLIDKSICELIPYCLRHEGVQLPENTEDAARMKALILKQVRGIKSDKKMVSYLNDKSYVTQLFGSRADCIDASASTYSGIRDRYEMNRQPIRNAIRRLRHILYRNGILLHTLSNAGYVAGQAIPNGKKLSDHLRYRALINWSDLLLEQLTDGISFRRHGETYSIREIIAAVANIALENNIEKRHNLARLRYDDNIITTSQIRNIIYRNITRENFQKSKQELEHIATELHRNLFGFAADELGFFSRPLNIAIDPTSITLESKLDPEKVPGAMGDIRVEGGGVFKFATGTSFGSLSRFSLGVSLVTDKSTLSEIYRRLILVLGEFTTIGWILADREFDDPRLVEMVRTEAGNTWITRLRDHGDVIDEKEYRQLEKEGKATVSIGDIEVNAFWKDISKLDLEWVFRKEEDDDKLILMSGLPLDETSISDLSRRYSKRWSAETHIRQLKHDFTPEIPGKYAFDYLFFLNISSIFYNIYKIINQSLSPRYGLPLRPRYYEVLWAIAHSTFRCRCCCSV